MVRNMSEGFGV